MSHSSAALVAAAATLSLAVLPGPATASSHEKTLTCDDHTYVATIVGTSGPDRIVGTPGDDVIVALGGRDVIDGRGGDDVICAGAGADRISGGAGSDKIFGGVAPTWSMAAQDATSWRAN